MTDTDDPRAALDAVGQTNERLAERMHWPLWRHALVGLLLALLLLGIALPFNWQVVTYAVVLAMIGWIVRDDKKRYGMFVSGYQRGRTGWVLAAITLFFVALMLLTNTLFDEPTRHPLFWGFEIALFTGGTALSVLWEKIYRADLLAGRA